MSQVSAHRCLNIARDIGLHGRLPGMLIAYICMEAATLTPRNLVHGRLPGSGCLPGILWYVINVDPFPYYNIGIRQNPLRERLWLP